MVGLAKIHMMIIILIAIYLLYIHFGLIEFDMFFAKSMANIMILMIFGAFCNRMQRFFKWSIIATVIIAICIFAFALYFYFYFVTEWLYDNWNAF